MIGNLLSHARFRLSAILLLIVLGVICPTVFAQYAPDEGIPDSVYFGEVRYSAGGTDCAVRAVVPLLVYCDQFSVTMQYSFRWSANADFDTIFAFNTGPSDSLFATPYIDHLNNYCSGAVTGWNFAISPTNGTELILEMVFSVPAGDTLHLFFTPNDLAFSNLFDYWKPLVNRTDSAFVVEFVPGSPGDADCSGIVTISDAVFLINYIFSGGNSPYDFNAADPDASCLVTISDAVYLINYIFAGGPGPLAGCVNR